MNSELVAPTRIQYRMWLYPEDVFPEQIDLTLEHEDDTQALEEGKAIFLQHPEATFAYLDLLLYYPTDPGDCRSICVFLRNHLTPGVSQYQRAGVDELVTFHTRGTQPKDTHHAQDPSDL